MIKLYNGVVQFDRDYTKKAKYELRAYFTEDPLIKINNVVFKQTFIFSHFERGKSSVVGVFISKDKLLKVSMFISDLETILLRTDIKFPEITGYWTFVKKGMNIGIEYIGSEQEQPIISNLDIKNIEELLGSVDS